MLYGPPADVEKPGRVRLRGCANFRMLVHPTLHVSEPCRRHRPLEFVEVPAVQVEADDVAGRIVAGVFLPAHRDASLQTSAVAVSAVQDFVFVQDDRLAQSVLADVRH